MGYSTDFMGEWQITPKLHPKTLHFLKGLAESRRMKRSLPENLFGKEGEFFIDGEGFRGQDKDMSIIDNNEPPGKQPSLWCQWIPNDEGTAIKWDGGEKFYEYVEWIHYIINTVLGPNGYKLNGQVDWRGEEFYDIGSIKIENNSVNVVKGLWT